MAANSNAVAREPVSARKPKDAPQSSSTVELKEASASQPSGITETATEASAVRALPDAPNLVDCHEEVARVAYCIAEARGFEPGHELDDWLAAEQQIGLR